MWAQPLDPELGRLGDEALAARYRVRLVTPHLETHIDDIRSGIVELYWQEPQAAPDVAELVVARVMADDHSPGR
jgi:hypothetical protein